MTDEKTRKKRFAAEYKVKIMDEGKKLIVKKNTEATRKFEGKGKTLVDVHPLLKTSAEKNVKEARLNELSSKTTGAYVSKATDDYVAASKNRDEKRRTKRLSGILRAHRLEKKRDGLSESVKTTNAGYGYHGTHDKAKADAEFLKAHAAIKKIVGGESKSKDKKNAKSAESIPDRVVTHYLDSGHGRRLSGRLDDHEYVRSDFKKFRQNYNPSLFGEEVEDIDELSNKTMKSYVDRARVSSDTGDEKTVLKRNRGVKLALARAKKRFPEKFKEEAEMNEFTVEEFLEYLGGLTEEQAELELDMLDELSRSHLSAYVSKAKGQETTAKAPRRLEGIKLALKKKWGDAKYGLSEPRVKATEEVAVSESAEHEAIYKQGYEHGLVYRRFKTPEAKYGKDVEHYHKGIKDGNSKYWANKRAVDDDADNDAWHEKQQSRKIRGGVHYHEEVEPIDELSKQKVYNYLVHSSIDKSQRAERSGFENGTGFAAGYKDFDRQKKDNETHGRRSYGIQLAAAKLAGMKKGPDKVKVPASEEISFVDQLTAVAESRGMSVVFGDGTKAAISPGTARRLLDRYETVGEAMQEEFIEKISSNLKTLRESVLR